MNIYHVISNKVWGGGEQYVFDLCQRLIRDGHHVELFCRPFPPVVLKLHELGVPIHPVALKGMASVYRIAHVIEKGGGGILHVHNFKDAFPACYAASLVRGDRVKVIVTRHLVRKGKTSLPYRWLYKRIDKIVFVSELAKQAFLSTHPVVADEKLEVIHNSIVLKPDGQAESLRKMLFLPHEAVIAMFHGRLAAEKGLDVLVEALAKTGKECLHLILIGRGAESYTMELKKKAVMLGIVDRVHFLGFKGNVFPYLQQADFGVVPSVAAESFSLSCIEYMSQGKCVVATNHGGQTEYLKNGVNSILVPPSDVDALAVALRELTENKEKREALSKQAQQDFVSTLNYDQFYQKILSVYQD